MSETLVYAVAAATGLAVYLAPAAVAYMRLRRHWRAILVLTILVGWTVIGWIGAMVWAWADPPDV